MTSVLILGVNGFIGHHLATRILATTDWLVHGVDLRVGRVQHLLGTSRFQFHEADQLQAMPLIDELVRACDVVLPLVAVATPATYVDDPLRVFELDFESNLPVVRACVEHRKRLLFPSTSEVYGMCSDEKFDPASSALVTGPIAKTRWIYSCSKQLMDRIIWAYGAKRGLDFTLFRPFNWIGVGLDDLADQGESRRVISQFIWDLVHGEPLRLVNGGRQRRCFTDVEEGIDALMTLIENPGGIASGMIYNIGNPNNDHTIRELAESLIRVVRTIPPLAPLAARAQILDVPEESFYGAGYQDVERRVPAIEETTRDLGWTPSITLEQSIDKVLRASCDSAGALPRVAPLRHGRQPLDKMRESAERGQGAGE